MPYSNALFIAGLTISQVSEHAENNSHVTFLTVLHNRDHAYLAVHTNLKCSGFKHINERLVQRIINTPECSNINSITPLCNSVQLWNASVHIL